MTKTSNKAQIMGSTMALIVATIAIALILILLAISSSLFTSSVEIEKSTNSFSYQLQASNSLSSLLRLEKDNFNLADMIRQSKLNSTYKEKAESELNVFSEIFSKWGIDAEGIFLGDIAAFRDGLIVKKEIPNFGKNIVLSLAVKNE